MRADVPNGILLEQSTARELGVAPGDTLTLETQGRTRLARIQGLFSGAMPGETRLPIAFHRDLADLEARSTGMLVRADGDLVALARRIAASADVQQVLSKKQVSDEILAASGQLTTIIELGAMVSIAIASLFVFACLGYIILQRQGEYQSLRLLGYSDALVRGIIVVEICLISLAALLAAVPVGALTADYLNSKMSEVWFQIDTIISLQDYLKTFIPSFVLLPLVALPIARMVLREPLHLHLRSREIA
ncbi:FtsX-like permease family protein [Massilia sp. B-10]|nr:FtsX-like permease family protein [Massilia sp. B-10]